MEIITRVILGLIAGLIATKLMRGASMGVVWNTTLGMIGSVVGGWLFSLLQIRSMGGMVGELVTSVAGACLLLFLFSAFSRRGK